MGARPDIDGPHRIETITCKLNLKKRDGGAMNTVALSDVIGTTHGAGDESTTFNLPDIRSRVVLGQDEMGGTSANRLTNQA